MRAYLGSLPAGVVTIDADPAPYRDGASRHGEVEL
jgi:hypothetical protein